MIDILQKLPDSLIGLSLALALWFGLNYAMLAERAMQKTLTQNIIPSCVKELTHSENQFTLLNIPPGLIPQTEGLNLQGLFAGFQNQFRLSSGQRLAICQCAANRSAQSVRLDYAVHTASFRIVKPNALTNLRQKTLSLVRSEFCGALPWLKLKR